MYSSRLFQLALLVVAVISVAQASWWSAFNLNISPRALIRRQNDDEEDTGNSPTDVLPTDAIPTPITPPDEGDDDDNGDGTEPTDGTSEPPVTQTTSSVDEEPTETVPTITADPTTSSAVEEEVPTTSSVVEEETTSVDEGPTTTSNGDASETTSNEPVVSTSVEIVTKTNSDGTKETSTTTSKTTSTPDLSGDGGDTSGLSTKNRNIIIGVVVGVGGAIVIGALGLVAWRIWGRKKRAEENDGLMDFNYSERIGSPEKTEPPSSAGAPQRSPFQSTLENHHQPTPVNASSNF